MEEEKDPFDAVVDAAEARTALRRRAMRDFIKGPIDWPWVLAAYKAGGQSALLVGLSLWRLKGLQGADVVVWEAATKRQLDMHERTRRRAVAALKQAGLVSVEDRGGGHGLITILLPEIPHERR